MTQKSESDNEITILFCPIRKNKREKLIKIGKKTRVSKN